MSGVVLSLLFIRCESDEPAPSEIDEAYDVYSLLIDSLIQDVAVISAESYSGLARFSIQETYIDNIIEFYPDFPESLVRELPEVDEDSLIYENRFEVVDKEIVLLTAAESKDLYPPGIGYQESWQIFFDTFGETAQSMSLSRIAFNEERTEAVFAATTGRWAYYGYMVYCEKENGVWVIKSIVNTWVT